MILSLFSSLGFGIGISLILFGSTLYYKSFVEDTAFNNPLVLMSVSFAFLSIGLGLIYGILI